MPIITLSIFDNIEEKKQNDDDGCDSQKSGSHVRERIKVVIPALEIQTFHQYRQQQQNVYEHYCVHEA